MKHVFNLEDGLPLGARAAYAVATQLVVFWVGRA